MSTNASVYVVFSSKDCSNGLVAVENFHTLPNTKNLYIIQPKRAALDHQNFVKVYGLKFMKDNFIFSDSLFKKYKFDDEYTESSIVIQGNTGPQYMKYSFAEFDKYKDMMIQYLSDTFLYRFPEQITGNYNVSSIVKNKYFVFNDLISEVNVCSMWTRNPMYKIAITDSQIIKAYQVTFGDEFQQRFETSVGSLNDPSKWRRRNNKMEQVQFDSDGKTIYAMIEHTYLIKEADGKKMGLRFKTLNKFIDGNLYEVNLVIGFMGNPKEIKSFEDVKSKKVFNGCDFVLTQDEKLFLDVLARENFDSLPYFFVQMKKEKKYLFCR